MTTSLAEPMLDPPAEDPGARGMRVFQIINAAQFVSMTGSGLTRFALGVWIYQASGSATLFALTQFFAVVPYILASPFAGAAVDRWNRRLMLVVGDAGAALSILTIAVFLWRGTLTMVEVYVATALSAIFGAFQGPAFSATVPLLVAKRDLPRASGLAQMANGIAQIIAPALAGVLVVAIGIHGVLLVDCATFLVAIVTVLSVAIPATPRAAAPGEHPRRSLLADASVGWGYLAERRGLLALVLLFGVTNFFMGSVLALSTPLILSSFRPAALGTAMTVAGLGLLAGSLALGRVLAGRGRTLRVLAATAFGGVCIAAAGLRPSLPLIAVAAFGFFFATQIMSGGFQVVVQCKVAPELQGRIFATSALVANSTLPLAYLTSGPLADRVFEPLLRPGGRLAASVGAVLGVGPGRGIGLVFVIMGALIVAAVAGAWLFPRLRHLDAEMPDLLPDHAPAAPPRAVAHVPLRAPARPRSALVITLMLLAVGAGLLALWLEATPPAALPASAPEAAFSAARALQHVEEIAREPRPVGSAAHDRVRDRLASSLRGLGLEPHVEEARARVQQGVVSTLARPQNVVATLPGTRSTGTLLLVAHYDSVPTGPGAADDAAGLAAIVETVRALRSGPQLRNDLLVLFTDAEEIGSLGARAFVTAHPELAARGVVINLEARGTGGPVLLFETSRSNAALVAAVGRAVPRPLAASAFEIGYGWTGNRTDLEAFEQAGFGGLNLAFIDGPVDYHSAQDRLGRLDPRALQHLGDYALGLARDLGSADLERRDAGAAVFWTLPAGRLVAYRAAWALPLALAAAIALGFVVARGVVRKRLAIPAVLAGAAVALASALCAAAGVAFVWWVIQAVRVEDVKVTWSDAYRFGAYAAGLALLTAAVVVAVVGRAARSLGAQEAFAGALCLWAVLAVGAGVWAPGASPLLVWPLLAGTAVLAIGLRLGRAGRSTELALLSIGAAPGLVLLMPFAYWVLLGVSLVSSWAVAPLLALGLALLAPHVVLLAPRARRGLLVGLGVAALALVGWAAAVAAYDVEHRRPDSLAYALDADRGVARWVSTDPAADPWTKHFVSERAAAALPLFFPASSHHFLQGPAPALPLPPPLVTVAADEERDGVRHLRLRVRSARWAPVLQIALEPAGLLGGSVDGVPLDLDPATARSFPLVIQRWGDADRDLELTLEARVGAALGLTVVDHSFALPDLAPLGLPPRPGDAMPAQFGLGVSDVTMVGRTLAGVGLAQ
jgi:MFS family permease